MITVIAKGKGKTSARHLSPSYSMMAGWDTWYFGDRFSEGEKNQKKKKKKKKKTKKKPKKTHKKKNSVEKGKEARARILSRCWGKK